VPFTNEALITYFFLTVIKPLKEERIQIIREVEMLAQRESDELYAREHPH
jgi:hypothetical protein